MITTVAQRWRDQRASYRPAGEPFDPRGWSAEPIADDTTPRAFLAQHHYLRTLPPTQRRFGLYAPGGALSGVAIFGVPTRLEVFRPLPGGYADTCVLSRFALLDEVRGNGETWFLARCLDALRREGRSGVATFADPVPRRTLDGRLTTPGHVGNAYQAASAVFIGQRRAESLLLLPDATSFDRRTLSKAKSGERGQRYAIARLVAAGAELPRGLDLAAWVAEWLPRVTRAVKHAGNLKYVIPLTTGARRDVKRAVGEGLAVPEALRPRTLPRPRLEAPADLRPEGRLMDLPTHALPLPVAPDASPSPAASVDARRHWRVLPELDHRHGVAARDRGVLHLGHTRVLPCLGCAAPRSTPAERPTVPVRGDRALPPTLRPLPPPSERVAPRRAAPRPSRHRTPPPPPTPLNARQRILVALASLGEGPVTLAALAVRAWQLCPTAFGLRGFERIHPDSNRVWAKLSGTDGLGALGWCTRPAPAQVEITAKGRRVAAALAKAGAR